MQLRVRRLACVVVVEAGTANTTNTHDSEGGAVQGAATAQFQTKHATPTGDAGPIPASPSNTCSRQSAQWGKVGERMLSDVTRAAAHGQIRDNSSPLAVDESGQRIHPGWAPKRCHNALHHEEVLAGGGGGGEGRGGDVRHFARRRTDAWSPLFPAHKKWAANLRAPPGVAPSPMTPSTPRCARQTSLTTHWWRRAPPA